MPRPTMAEIRAALDAATDPAHLVEMTAADLAVLAGPNPTPAAARAIAATAQTPNVRLAVSAGTLRPDLAAPPPAPPPATAAPRTLNQPPPTPPAPNPGTKTT